MMCELIILPHRQPTGLFGGETSERRKIGWKTSIILQQGNHQGLSERRVEEIKKYERSCKGRSHRNRTSRG
ncbi:hypothetical protein KGF38_20020 [Clostridioides sp. ZZV14-6387]|nr:hypothetical protein [Clostridioides sp. ZZV14-6387]